MMKKKTSVFSPFAIVMIVLIVACSAAELVVSNQWPLSLIRIVGIAAAVCGVTNCVLSSDGSIWNYFFGLPAVLFQGIVALSEGNIGIGWMDLLFLVPMQVIGFFMWMRHGASVSSDGEQAQVKGRRLDNFQRFDVCVLLIVLILGLSTALFHFGATSPWFDAAAVVMQIVAQILMTLVFMEQWAVWIVVNATYLCLWTHTAILEPGSNAFVMIAMWACYFVISIHGLRVWHRLSK